MAEHCEVLVLGAGPAGLAAAAAAAAHGLRVGLVDAQPRAGGQVWRHDVAHPAPARARRALRNIADVKSWFGARVVTADVRAHTLQVEGARDARQLRWDRLVLATGARELLLPFPGWTLPGVTGAGGLQALVKQGWPIAGRRVVVAGSGPLLLAAAAVLRAHGARVLAIIEQAARSEVYAFARGLWRWPEKLTQALRLRAQLTGVPLHYGALVRRTYGEGSLRAVDVECGGQVTTLECEHLAVGFGLVADTESARLLGCVTHGAPHPAVRVDELQQTTVQDVYAAGEICGIGGMQAACVQGAIAGHAAAGDPAAARRLFPARARTQQFAAALAKTFALRPQVHELADTATIVCRCEDVSWGALCAFDDARSAKLATRCGMGPCQGRICGAALAELKAWSWHGHARPPLLPARLATLADGGSDASGAAAGSAL